MALKKIQIINRLTDNLVAFSASAHAKSLIGLYDDTRGAQDFFKGLFNILYGYELVELDKLHEVTNYKAIDLGDGKHRIAIQVTIQNDSYKINQTIKKFIEEKLFEDYDRLVIFIIGKKLAYTSAFETKNKFEFDHTKDVWDDAYLIKQIDKIDDIAVLEKLDSFLKENIDVYINADHLYDEDIKECILSLETNLGNLLVTDVLERIIPSRSDHYIEDKNAANNLSWEFFQSSIQCHMSFNTVIEAVLHNPINKYVFINMEYT